MGEMYSLNFNMFHFILPKPLKLTMRLTSGHNGNDSVIDMSNIDNCRRMELLQIYPRGSTHFQDLSLELTHLESADIVTSRHWVSEVEVGMLCRIALSYS